MSRNATSFILGYHGCNQETAEAVVNGTASLVLSDKPYDWLGPGVYFWEGDRQRAFEWAQARCKTQGGEPAVLGAVIDLGNCLDLLSRSDQDLVRRAHTSLSALYEAAGEPMPENENSKLGGDTDRRLRKLDCAVIRHIHELAEDDSEDAFLPFDTVRGMFTEGAALYPGSAFFEQSHVQIAVRNLSCIKGVFFALPDGID